MARPTKLNPELRDRIVKAVRAGNYAEPAARACGISPSTFYRWLQRGESEPNGSYYEFAQAIHRAEAEAEVYAVAILRRAMGEDWRPRARLPRAPLPRPLAATYIDRANGQGRRPDPNREPPSDRPLAPQ